MEVGTTSAHDFLKCFLCLETSLSRVVQFVKWLTAGYTSVLCQGLSYSSVPFMYLHVFRCSGTEADLVSQIVYKIVSNEVDFNIRLFCISRHSGDCMYQLLQLSVTRYILCKV